MCIHIHTVWYIYTVNCVIKFIDMSAVELRERLIEKIQKTDNKNILVLFDQEWDQAQLRRMMGW